MPKITLMSSKSNNFKQITQRHAQHWQSNWMFKIWFPVLLWDAHFTLFCSHLCSFFVSFLYFLKKLSISFSPDSSLNPSSLSLSSLSIPFSFFFPSRILSRSNSVCTPGCHGNQRRPPMRVDEQKTQRPSSKERGRESRETKFNFYLIYFSVACVCVWCVCGKNEEVDEEEGGMES